MSVKKWMDVRKRISHYMRGKMSMGIVDSRINPFFENEMLTGVVHDEKLVESKNETAELYKLGKFRV